MSHRIKTSTSPELAASVFEKTTHETSITPSRPLKHPMFVSYFVILFVLGGLAFLLYQPGNGFMNWYTSIAWCVPIVMTVLGAIGFFKSRKQMARQQAHQDLRVDDPLVVTIPTIGRKNTLPSLWHVIESFDDVLAAHFNNYRIDVVVEEGCEAFAEIQFAETAIHNLRVVMVPRDYQTQHGTKFKGRANQYALELRTVERESTANTWILHMDDDTAARADTIRTVAQYITENRDPETGLHVGQGVLTYDLNRSPNQMLWLADSIRATDDMTRFAATTGSGTPHAGMHGELMLVRASVEKEIGWDFGPDELVEDSRFAMEFANKYPGKSGWFSGRCYGSSPETVRDFIKQRSRWSEGILGLALNREIPFKNRALILYGALWWAVGLLQHAFPAIIIGLLVFNDPNMSPAYAPIAGVWVINMAYVMWGHWEGLKINAAASGLDKPHLRHKLAILPMVYIFAIWEGYAGMKGAVRHISRKVLKTETKFEVIAKQH